MNKPKRIGTKAETAVTRFLAPNGFPHVERRQLRGAKDAGDITGTPGICWSVKGGDMARYASDLDIERWLGELDEQRIHARADIGVLVIQRKGVGPANAGRWWAIVRGDVLARLIAPDVAVFEEAPSFAVRMLLSDVVTALRWAGYGHEYQELEVAP